ncbi:MAG: hypothetical protein H6858_00855 [Rhodospirillales bacterium]|nr:hypothetical protein [Alphaproteobacteria bacterium]MCB1841188.1 hypothetical protein [Alphaproteobacteria bacterium]MCB9976129.1 hypothetical protein [Rhodospirillales bacterium]
MDQYEHVAPESFEEMSLAERENWQQARSRLAGERPEMRIALRQKFAGMSAGERKAELAQAQAALETLDQSDQIGDFSEEDPFDRDYRIKLEETVKMLSSDPEWGVM